MNKLLKIDNIMIYVKNLERSAQFYQDTLGLERVWTDTERSMIGFMFSESESEIVIHNDFKLPNPFFSFLVEDVAQFCEKFREEGNTILCEPFDVRCGKFAILADVDGNAIPIVDLTKFDNEPQYDE